MKIAYKPDWKLMETRMRAWWAGEWMDRPIMQVYAPKAGCEPPHWSTWSLIQDVERPEPAIDGFDALASQTFYGGEAFPNLWVNLGPGIPAAYLGREPRITENTVWFESDEVMPWHEILNLELRDDDKWWSITRRLTALAAEKGRDKFFVSITDLNGVHNILGFLRGTQQLLIDCIDDPALVRRASALITDIWLACYDTLLSITQRDQEGCSSWMGIWFPGVGSDVQCDFAAMLSPTMFERLVLPDLRRQCQHMEQSIFHWDGPGQIPHLDHLLSIPELDGIQWVPGDGNPDCGSPRWFPLYQRILDSGKRLVLQTIKPEAVRGVIEAVGHEGLLITTRCDNEQEAQDLIAQSIIWSKSVP